MRAIRKALPVGVLTLILLLAGSNSVRAGAVAVYSLDDSTVSGNTVADSSGNGYDGMVLSGVATSQPGRFAQAFSFSGVDSEVSAPAPYTFGTSFSISLWFNTNDLGQSQKYLLLHGTSGPNQNAIAYGYVPNTVQIYAPASAGPSATPAMVPGSEMLVSQADTWVSIIYTYDGSQLRGYVNGNLIVDVPKSFDLNATGPLYIGSASQAFPVNNFVGLLDDVAIFDSALTPAQVAFLQSNPAATLFPAMRITTTGIFGYGTALSPEGGLAARGPSSFPLNDSGTVAVNEGYVANASDVDSFLLTSDGVTYTTVNANGPGTFLTLDGFAINNIGTLTYQRGPIFEGNPSYYQFFSLAAPYTGSFSAASAPDPSYAFNLYTNTSGAGVTLLQDSTTSQPKVVRLDGNGTATPLTIDASSWVAVGERSTKIQENGDIYISLLNYDSQAYEIWRFAAGDTATHTVVYALPAVQGGLQAWDVNASGTLLVAESDAQGGVLVKTIAAGGVPTVVEGTQIGGPGSSITNALYRGVFVNDSGLMSAVRGYTDAGTTSVSELLYARPGSSAQRVLKSGDSLNGGVILNIAPTSEMNASGQLTVFMQLDVSPISPPTRSLVVRVNPSLGPTITSFSPGSGAVGALVTISGSNFTNTSSVSFNGSNAAYTVTAANEITATVPGGATTGPISVTTPSGTAESATSFTVVAGAPPSIASFSPTSGAATTATTKGTRVIISGANFGGATSVTFNGTSATFKLNGTSQITATVPIGATTGPIAVTTPAGVATSASSFTVLVAPTIDSFSPATGPGGTSVEIRGTNFSGATSVQFNRSNARFVVESETLIRATVPNGAKSGPISVTTPGGVAVSASNFSVIK